MMNHTVLHPQRGPMRAAAEAHRALGDGVEDGLEVGGGARDHAQDLGGGGLALQGLGKVPRPRLHLLLEIRVGLLEPRRHAVELLGEGLELVARLHVDALA